MYIRLCSLIRLVISVTATLYSVQVIPPFESYTTLKEVYSMDLNPWPILGQICDIMRELLKKNFVRKKILTS